MAPELPTQLPRRMFVARYGVMDLARWWSATP